jgi:hypothetical protein
MPNVIIFQINGGIGKCIASTAVCASIKQKYPTSKLIVVSGYPEVYLNNPNVDRTYAFGGQQYFYKEYIENQEILVLAHDPYLETKNIKCEEHLIETWCNMFNLPIVKKKGELFLTKREVDFFANKYNSDKPILLLQTNGGGQSELKYSWARDIPSYVVLEIIKTYSQAYNIVHIRRDDQIKYDGTIGVQDNFRGLLVLIAMSEKRLLMDSFAQHAAAALDKPSSVLWIANSPIVFGYDMHTNIIANKETNNIQLRSSYLNKYNISGDLQEFPYNDEREMFNLDEIIESLK